MLEKLIEQASSIIREARQSTLGVVSLIVLAISVVAVMLFKDVADVTAKIIILAMLALSFIVFFSIVIWSSYRVASGEAEEAEPAVRPASAKAARPSAQPGFRLVAGLVLGSAALLLLVVWLGFDALFYREDFRRVTEGSPDHVGGWTTIFEERQVLQGRGGTLSLYPREQAPGYQVYVIVPRSRVLQTNWMKDGGGNDFLAVTVRPP